MSALGDKVRAVVMANPVSHGLRGFEVSEDMIVIERGGQMVAYFNSEKLEPVPDQCRYLAQDDPCLPAELQVGCLVLPMIFSLESAMLAAKERFVAKGGGQVTWPRGVDPFNSRSGW